MTTYLALTIGPIYKTLSSAKKTRELWGGSYIFSYIMRKIVEQLQDREFIVPYIKDETIFQSGKGVGLFHDRFIFEAKEGDTKEGLQEIVDSVLSQLSKDTKIDEKFIKEYLQIYIVQRELKSEENPILEIMPYLDSAELAFNISQYQENSLTKMLRGDSSFLINDAFGEERKSFSSLPEISMYDILKKTDIKDLLNYDDELSFYEKTTYKDIMKRYHKYYAIVHADGDSMGEVIKNLKSKEDFQAFSKNLFDYCIQSDKIIKDYGATTIFAGGDDLLFFAPVVSYNETIFDLCHNISNIFDTIFKGTEATLSFGISIHYYKYPLYEALANSRDLLFVDAKSGDKNSIAFSVTKHSGQTFKSIIHKGDKEIYENFRLFSSNIQGGKDIDNFLHSIHHKIYTNKEILTNIADNKEQLVNFFDNYFNEEVHKEYRDFFAQLIEFIYEAYQKDKDSAFDIVYATLRFIKFVQGDK